jgi:hypothetical protein
MGLHICAVVPRTTDRRGEYVELANDGPVVALTGLKVTDYTASQQHVHIYTVPAAVGGGILTLGRGQVAYIFTGPGKSQRSPNGNFYLFVGRRAPVWNDAGDVAYLRRPNGTFIDTMTVGHPKRHPNGH